VRDHLGSSCDTVSGVAAVVAMRIKAVPHAQLCDRERRCHRCKWQKHDQPFSQRALSVVLCKFPAQLAAESAERRCALAAGNASCRV